MRVELGFLTRTGRVHVAWRYAMAILLSLAALYMRSLLTSVLGSGRNPYHTAWLAVVIAAWYLGLGPSILTAVVQTVGVWYYFLLPFKSFHLESLSDIGGLIGFAALSSLIVALGETNRRSLARQRTAEARLDRDLHAMSRLQAVGSRCAQQESPFSECLSVILDAAIHLTAAEKGTLQLRDDASRTLRISSSRGFEEPFLTFFKEVADNSCVCGAARASQGRVVVEDVTQSTIFGQPTRGVLLDSGVRAVQSTPLISSAGKVLGMISTHFSRPHRPGERELRFLDLLARQAADYIERKQADETLRSASTELRKSRDELEFRVEQRTHQLVEANQELSTLTARLLQSQDDERRRLARELHDSAGQLLAVLGMNISQLERSLPSNAPNASAIVTQSQNLVQQLTKEIRTASYLLHPPLLDESGLASALNMYVDGSAERSGLKIDLAVSENFGRLSHNAELAIFRVVQEALTNIHRHSGSKTASIRLVREPEIIVLEIRDQGHGIASEKLAKIESSAAGVGIGGMRQRVRHFGGDIKIESTDKGTSIVLSVPTADIAVPEARSAVRHAGAV